MWQKEYLKTRKMKSKKCPKCNEVKQVSEFSKRGDSRLGLMSWCKPCNREKVSKWRSVNKEKVNEYQRKWNEANRDKVNSKQKKYRSLNPLKIRSSKMLLEAKVKSIRNNVPFNIDFEYVYNLCENGKCSITGLDFEILNKRGPRSPSLDRIVPRLGYTKGNVRVILWALNAFKNEWSDSEIYPIAKEFCRSYEEGLTNPANGTQGDPAAGCPPSVYAS